MNSTENSTENDNLVAQLIDANDQRDALAQENADLKELLVKMSEEQPARDDALVETVQKQAQMIKDLNAQVETLRKEKQELIQQRMEQEVRERELRAKNAGMHEHTQKWTDNIQAMAADAIAKKDIIMRAGGLPPSGVMCPNDTSTSDHVANTIAKISNLLSILNQQIRNDSVESAEKIDQLTKERDVAIATMKEHAIQLGNRFDDMRKESLDALKDVRTKAESVAGLLGQRTNDLANVIEQRDNCIRRVDELERSLKLRTDALNAATLERDQHVHANTVRLENANKLQNMSACKHAELQKKLDESDSEVRRMREMLTLRTDEKAKLQKQLDDLQPILSALSKHWGKD